MPLQATSGAASYDAFGGGVPAVPNYIEEVFSCFLYTGTSASQTITNGIDLSTKGGMIWLKSRSNVYDNYIVDTVRGFSGSATRYIVTNSTAAQNTDSILVSPASTGFLTNGFTLADNTPTNFSGYTYASWTFRKQPKFFDVVTYTGTGSAQTIAHSLGSVPGSIFVKRTNTTSNWRVYHRSLTSAAYMVELNTSAGQAVENGAWNSTAPTSSVFTVGSASEVNASGSTYVAYIFAHDAGGFGLLGTDNVISCGSFTTNGSGVASVNLGYEPQWVVAKAVAGGTGSWVMQDIMRGFTASPAVYTNNPLLFANSADSEATFGGQTLQATSTGFTTVSATYDPSVTYIYIAIRRGPMKVPTSGTSVFTPLAYTNSTGGVIINSLTYPADLVITDRRNTTSNRAFWDRLRGATKAIYSNLTNAEGTVGDGLSSFASNVGYTTGSGGSADNTVDGSQINWIFRRAPSFFDEVCYTGTGTSTAFNHNLTVVPEMIITKIRDSAFPNWGVWHNALSPSSAMLFLNTTGTQGNGYVDTVTSTTFSFATANGVVNSPSNTYVAYLFATCAGVSKVGSYTGNGSTQTINCGFGAGGARFVLIKRTDSTGDWYVYDTARGMTVLTDPYLLLNSTAAEVATLGSVTTVSTGFALNATILAAINTNAASYIFLAIA